MVCASSRFTEPLLSHTQALSRRLQAKALSCWQQLTETQGGAALVTQIDALVTQLETALHPLSQRGFEAVSEALYPANTLGAPSGAQLKLGERFEAYLALVPPESRRLLRTLYAAVEFGVPLLGLKCSPLSRLSPSERLAIFTRLKASKFFLFRMLAEAVKSSSTMLYLSHPETARYIGESKPCGDETKHHRHVNASAFEGLLPRAQSRNP